MGGTDIHIAVAQDAGLCDGGGRVHMQIVLELVTNLHRHFHRCGIAIGNHAHMRDITDGDALKGNGRSIFDPGGVFKVRTEDQLPCEQTTG